MPETLAYQRCMQSLFMSLHIAPQQLYATDMLVCFSDIRFWLCAISISYVGNSCFIQTNSTLQPMLSEYSTVLNEYWKIIYILKSFKEVLNTKCVLFATWLFKCNFWLQNTRYICNSFRFKIAMLENLIICLSKEWRDGGISLQFNFMIFNNLISQPSGIDFIIWF